MTYTYRGGKKLTLEKRPDQFVARALPDQLRARGVAPDAEQVSSASSRVVASPSQLDEMMARARAIAPTHHAYTVADSGQDFLITDRIFVTFHDALAPEAVAEFAGRYGLIERERYSPREYLFQLTNHTGLNPVKLVVRLSEDEPLVAMAENDLNYVVAKQVFVPPSDPDYRRQWHLNGQGGHPDIDPRSHVRCESAWRLLDGFGDAGVVIGVTDDGCKLDHSDFDSPGKFAGWGYFRGTRLFVNSDADAEPGGMYQTGANHGTSCAGVIAGETDARLTVGAAPGCRLLPVKWESQGPSLLINDSKMLSALGYVADKVDILSNSWGTVPVFLFAGPVINRIRQLAIDGGRRGRGILFLWAAGNDNCPILHEAALDVPYTHGWQEVAGSWQWAGPRTARHFENNMVNIPGVMHVAALASTARRSHYSNYGTGIDLCAPTSNSHAYFRMSVAGLGVTTTTGASGGLTNDFGGTSSATPLVAGIAALVLSANPTLSAFELASVLRRTASKNLDTTPYPRTPPADYDRDTAWDVSPIAPFDNGGFQDLGLADGSWSPWFGHGRVDAEQAVAFARGQLAPPVELGDLFVSSPGSRIPDNRDGGVRDRIVVARSGRLDFVQVSVDIRHSYVGDLVVTLIAPSGRQAVLHQRAGGGRDDLDQTWDSSTLAALRAFDGERAEGEWTLWVQDLAAADVGRLESWSLRLGIAALPPEVSAEEAPGVTIPDNQPGGIERVLHFSEAGTVAAIAVEVDISHSYIGDLRVSLDSPAGTEVVLHGRTGGGTDNLLIDWQSDTVAAITAFHGEAVAGDWHLRVQDLAARDVGKLNRWKLTCRLQPVAVLATQARKAPKRKAAAGKAKAAKSASPEKAAGKAAASGNKAKPKAKRAGKAATKLPRKAAAKGGAGRSAAR